MRQRQSERENRERLKLRDRREAIYREVSYKTLFYISFVLMIIMVITMAFLTARDVISFSEPKASESENVERDCDCPRESPKKSYSGTVSLGVSNVISQKKKEETVSLGVFRITAYCGCEKCCGVWGKNRPVDSNGKKIVYTAYGDIAAEGVTVAADPDILAHNTEIIIDGHTYTVQDKGGAIQDNRIDIYFENHDDAVRFGVKNVEVFLKGE